MKFWLSGQTYVPTAVGRAGVIVTGKIHHYGTQMKRLKNTTFFIFPKTFFTETLGCHTMNALNAFVSHIALYHAVTTKAIWSILLILFSDSWYCKSWHLLTHVSTSFLHFSICLVDTLHCWTFEQLWKNSHLRFAASILLKTRCHCFVLLIT